VRRISGISLGFIVSTALVFLGVSCAPNTPEYPDFSLGSDDIASGFEFITAESQALQEDAFSNPGYLWVETGQTLFETSKQSRACQSCHTDPEEEFKTSPLSYPKIDQASGKLINLEGRINLCRSENQNLPPLDYESEKLLALTSYVKSHTNGQTIDYEITEAMQPYFTAGKEYFYTRRGQLNLSCHQCHDQNWGKKMRGDIVSQGHVNGFPAYRNDWQALGSSHRRFSDCDIGVRAQPYPLGSQTYLNLEVYLMARGSGLVSETPAIRR